MDSDGIREEIAHKREVIKGYRQRQRALERQESILGMRTDPAVSLNPR